MKKQFILIISFISITFNALTWNTPTYDSPSNGSSAWTGLTLNWDPVLSSEGYQVQLDTSPNFNSPMLQMHQEVYINANSNNADTEEYFEDLKFGTIYYWRVRAYVTNDTSAWSNPINFTTRDYVPLDLPSHQSSIWTGTFFNWNAHIGVDKYEFQLDSSATFNSPILITHSENYINANTGNTDTEEWFNNLYFGQTYHWRVRAINAIDTSEWRGRTATTRDYVLLDSPSNGSVNISTSGISLDWDTHAGVAFYEVQWDSTNLYNSNVFQNHVDTYINGSSFNADTDEFSGTLENNTVYHWRVRAINTIDTSEWRFRYFSTGSSINIPDTPILLSPSNQAQMVATPTSFDWSDATNAQSYEIMYSTAPNFSTFTINNSSASELNGISLATNTIYYWKVRANHGGFYSNWSSVYVFDTFTCSPSTETQIVSTCQPYTWSDGSIYSNSGQYTQNLTSIEGCDSTLILDLNISNIDVDISLNNDVIEADNINADAYQWVDCNNGNTLINGANQSSFMPTQSGQYAVIITENNCSDTSECINITTNSLAKYDGKHTLQLFPNPANTFVQIYSKEKITSVFIFNTTGQCLIADSESNKINLSDLPKGIYFVRIQMENGITYNKKLIKR